MDRREAGTDVKLVPTYGTFQPPVNFMSRTHSPYGDGNAETSAYDGGSGWEGEAMRTDSKSYFIHTTMVDSSEA